MNITMLGTGSFASSHNSACVLIDEKILVDIPNGIMKEMKKMGYNVLDIETVLITHFHGDHYFDIPFLLLERKIFGKSEIPLNIICHKEGIDKIKELAKLGFSDIFNDLENENLVKFITYDKEIEIFDIKDYEINNIKVNHGDKIAYGYTIKKDNKTLGITGDTSICENVENMVEKSDVSICELSFEKGTEVHMGIDTLKELITKFPNKKIIATHMNDNVRKNILENESIGLLKVVEDGYKFTI